jgi:hypothetical protein
MFARVLGPTAAAIGNRGGFISLCNLVGTLSALELPREIAEVDDDYEFESPWDSDTDAAVARQWPYEPFPLDPSEDEERDRWWQHYDFGKRQAEILISNSRRVRDVLSDFGRELITGIGRLQRLADRYARDGGGALLPPEFLRPSFAERVRELLDYILHIPLPALPSARGEGRRFAAAIDSSIAQWVAGARYLLPLTLFLEVSIFLVPPAGGVDLDNVAMKVLPALRGNLYPIQPKSDPIRSYLAVELARLKQDPPDGMVTVILGADAWRPSPWEEARDAAARWFNDL